MLTQKFYKPIGGIEEELLPGPQVHSMLERVSPLSTPSRTIYASNPPGPFTSYIVYTKYPSTSSVTNIKVNSQQYAVTENDAYYSLSRTYTANFDKDKHLFATNTTASNYMLSTMSGQEIYANPDCNCLCNNHTNLKTFPFQQINWRYVTNISTAFRYCTNLTGIGILPDTDQNLVAINTFEFCYNITGAYVGRKVNYMRYTFADCYNLVNAHMSDSVELAYGVYYNCHNLRFAACGNKVTNIDNAYYNCRNLAYGVSGPNVLSMVNTYYSCCNMQSAEIGPKVTNLYHCFYNCSNLRGNIYFPKSVSNIFECLYNAGTVQSLNVYINNGNLNIRYMLRIRNASVKTSVFVPGSSSTAYTSADYAITGSAISMSTITNGKYNATYNYYVYYNYASTDTYLA